MKFSNRIGYHMDAHMVRDLRVVHVVQEDF